MIIKKKLPLELKMLHFGTTSNLFVKVNSDGRISLRLAIFHLGLLHFHPILCMETLR